MEEEAGEEGREEDGGEEEEEGGEEAKGVKSCCQVSCIVLLPFTFHLPCRFSLKHDSDGEGAPVDFKDFGKEKSRVRKMSESDSDSDGEREKRRERERQERKEKKKSPLDKMLELKNDREGGSSRDKMREKDRKEDRKPKYYRDIKPVKILGVTTEPGDLHFYVEWDSGVGSLN